MSNTVPVTYAPEHLLDTNNHSAERYQWLSNNCVKLADFLCTIPNNVHNQRMWTSRNEHHACGMRACAMGWATLSHIIPGLQYFHPNPNTLSAIVGLMNVAINGKLSQWYIAASSFFGEHALQRVFMNTKRGRVATINALYREAERLCKIAREKKAEENAAAHAS